MIEYATWTISRVLPGEPEQPTSFRHRHAAEQFAIELAGASASVAYRTANASVIAGLDREVRVVRAS